MSNSRLSGRTISALKQAGVTKPEQKTIQELLAIPNLGIKGVTEIAERIYCKGSAVKWPEFEPKPPPVPKCSHRVPITERCARCVADAEIREQNR